MADIRIDKLTLKLSGLSAPQSESLSRQIAAGLAAADFQAAGREIDSISTRVSLPQNGSMDALAEAVVAQLLRTLERSI